MKKVIIWGLKLGTHTHSYVHNGYYRASQYLGYETYWFDDNDDVSSFDFSDCVFITENNACTKMPVRLDCVYFNHYCDIVFDKTDRFSERLNHPKYYNFAFFADTWPDNVARKWPDKEELIELSSHHYLHQKTNTLTTIWATDLLPTEIEQIEPQLHNETIPVIYFVGTPQGPNISQFEHFANVNGKQLQKVGGWTGINCGSAPSIFDNVNLIRDSYISVDIRESTHLNHGRYYPCRLFKNISYGKWTGSNHPEIADLFGDYFTVDSNIENLYYKLVEDSRNCTYEKMKEAMTFVKDNHTYVNRLQDMFKLL
jgi:hypothetical protein